MATLSTDAKDNQIMQIFKDKAFNVLLLQVQKLKTPIIQEGDLYLEVISFFKYVSQSIGDIRHNSTGRDYSLKSKESIEFFGDELTQLLYQIVNKCCYRMSNSIPHNNCAILRYLIMFFRKNLAKYCEERKSDTSSKAHSSSAFQLTENASISDPIAPEQIVASGKDITPNVLENITIQYLCKFLLCFVDVASRKEDNRRRKRIIHAVICNLKRKLTLFINNVIPKVLKGDRFLVDGANNDRIFLQRYNCRKILTTTTSRLVGQFQQVQFGASFLSKDSKLYYGSESSIPLVKGTWRNQSKKSFMHISMKDGSNEKGKKWTPVWDNDVNFIEHLFMIIKPQVQLLQGELDLLRHTFSVIYNEHYWDGQAEEVINSEADIHRIRETNMFLKKGDDNEEYSFDLSKFLLDCKEEEYSNYEDLKGLQEHSALSVKLRILSICFEEIIAHVDLENKARTPQLLRVEYIPKIRYSLDSAFSNIMSAVATSDLNIAMVSCLNHAEFLVLDPIKSPITGKPHSKSSKMLDDYGTWAMAHIVFAGMATFDYDLLRRVKIAGKVRGNVIKKEREESEDDEVGSNNSDIESGEIGTLASKLTILESDRSLPSINDIYSLLKNAISNIDNSNLGLLQSILMDVLVLQPWTRNLDGSEEKAIYRMENVVNKSGKCVDLTVDTIEISDDDLEIIQKVNFSDLPTTNGRSAKQPLNHAATPIAKGGNEKKSPRTESTTKTIGDIDEQTSAHRKANASSIGKKCPERKGVALKPSFGDESESDTEDEEETDDLNAETLRGACKQLADLEKASYEDDDEADFEEQPPKKKPKAKGTSTKSTTAQSKKTQKGDSKQVKGGDKSKMTKSSNSKSQK